MYRNVPYVSREDFTRDLNMRDMTNTQVMDVFETADINKNGKLDSDE